jgi:hypothetical protein
MELRSGDHYGLPTRVTEIRTNGSQRDDFFKHLHAPPADFDPQRKTARAKGPFVVEVEAPPRSKIAWFSAGGNFATHQGDAARQTRNEMAYALEKPADFRVFYEADVPDDQAHWHYNADREVKLDVPARTVFIRYVGDPGVWPYLAWPVRTSRLSTIDARPELCVCPQSTACVSVRSTSRTKLRCRSVSQAMLLEIS